MRITDSVLSDNDKRRNEEILEFQREHQRTTSNTRFIFGSLFFNPVIRPYPNDTLKEGLPLIDSSILNQINMSLLTGYVLQAFMVAVIKPLL